MPKSCTTWGMAVRKRDKVCQVGKYKLAHLDAWLDTDDCEGPLEADHLIGRGNKALRNNLDNGILLCSWHHRLSPKLSHHGSPKAFWSFLEQYIPHRFEFREQNRNKIMKQEVFSGIS